MPVNVRPFWITGTIDGRTTPIEGGPARKDGGFRLRVLMRDHGSPQTALHIDGRVREDGSIVLMVEPDSGIDPGDIEYPGDGRIVITTRR